MAEAFHNVLKNLHPIPRMVGEFIPLKADGTKMKAVKQESQFFDMSRLNKKDGKFTSKGNTFSPLKVQDDEIDKMDIRKLVMGARHQI